MNDDKRIEYLAEVLKSYVPANKDPKFVDNFTSKVDTNDQERIISLVATLYDGLAYGNWPWVIAEMNKVNRAQ